MQLQGYGRNINKPVFKHAVEKVCYHVILKKLQSVVEVEAVLI